jgi:hypothetical protein
MNMEDYFDMLQKAAAKNAAERAKSARGADEGRFRNGASKKA